MGLLSSSYCGSVDPIIGSKMLEAVSKRYRNVEIVDPLLGLNVLEVLSKREGNVV